MTQYKMVVESCSSLRDALERVGKRAEELVAEGFSDYASVHIHQAGNLWVVYKEMTNYPDDEPQAAPTNPEAEQAVLGSLLIDPDAVLLVPTFLNAEDFSSERNGLIYRAILAIHERGEMADFVTLCDELERQGNLQKIGGAAYITVLVNNVPSAAYAQQYGQLVKAAATLRLLTKKTA